MKYSNISEIGKSTYVILTQSKLKAIGSTNKATKRPIFDRCTILKNLHWSLSLQMPQRLLQIWTGTNLIDFFALFEELCKNYGPCLRPSGVRHFLTRKTVTEAVSGGRPLQQVATGPAGNLPMAGPRETTKLSMHLYSVVQRFSSVRKSSTQMCNLHLEVALNPASGSPGSQCEFNATFSRDLFGSEMKLSLNPAQVTQSSNIC